MRRRRVLAAVAGGAVLGAGCSDPEVTERPTGEIDVEFQSEATRSDHVRLWLEDADGRVVEEFDSAFPAGASPGPSVYFGGLSGGPYVVTLATRSDRTSFEWSIDDCASLDVQVTVLANGGLDVERSCSPVSPDPPPPLSGERTRREQ